MFIVFVYMFTVFVYNVQNTNMPCTRSLKDTNLKNWGNFKWTVVKTT